MHVARILSVFPLLIAFSFCACKGCVQADSQKPAPYKVVPAAQGEIIEFGGVSGTNSLAAAMGNVLSQIHQVSGEKPSVGQVFRIKESNSAGVFFTVVDHAQANRQLAGLVIAAQVGNGEFQVGVVSDSANRFGQTANNMLRQLFAAWNPGGTPNSAPAASNGGDQTPPMRKVMLPDGTATLQLPDGWNVVPNQSGMGITTVSGPDGASLGLNLYYLIIDPNNPSAQSRLRRGIRFQNEFDFPINADLTKSFADIFQRIRGVTGQGPAPLKVDSVQPVAASQGQCVIAAGQLNPDGSAMRDMRILLCRSTPNQNGFYFFILTKCLLPLGASPQQRVTANAIVASYRADMQRAQARADAATAPMIAQIQQIYQQHQQALMSFTQQQIANTQQIGAEATARFSEHEDDISRQGQGFSNYLLDQTVVQNNNVGGTGMVGHSTQWNSVANEMVKANPNKYEIVNTPNYWKGVDY